MNKNNKKTIEIKGQLYDARNGLAVQPGTPAKSWFSIPVKEVSATTKVNYVTSVNRKYPTHNARRHSPKTSQILMRSAVKKPPLHLSRHLRVSENTDHLIAKPSIAKASVQSNIDAKQRARHQRAASLKQSERISHFVEPRENQAPKPANPAVQSWQPAPQTAPPSPPQTPTDRLLERALSQATAHQQPALPADTSKWWRLGMVAGPVMVLAVLVFGSRGFTRLQLQVASAKVGFSTSLPAYRPVGYNLGPLTYNSGIFASEFQTKSGSRSYTITQKSTSWDTQDLFYNYVSVTAPDAQAVQLGDRTLYLYGNGNATWVNGGIWYQLDSDGSLNKAQIIGVANSL